jgi:hypothetical protein
VNEAVLEFSKCKLIILGVRLGEKEKNVQNLPIFLYVRCRRGKVKNNYKRKVKY